ncbi:MAG TPA: hypothetical protein VGD80_07875 [Kofleriaceae bacterium]
MRDARFEVRLAPAELDAWRAIAARQGVSVAALVRFGVRLMSNMPDAYVRGVLAREQERRDTVAHAEQLASVRTTEGGG